MIRDLPRVMKRVLFPEISQMSLSVTEKCNSKCKTCNIWKRRVDTSKEWSFSEISEILSKNNSLIWISFTGGEPFLRGDMDQILQCAMGCSNLSVISMTTNGFSPEKIERDVSRALEIKSDRHLIIDVSINGRREKHDEISGITGSFERSMETYERLKKLNHRRLSVNLGFTLSEYNLGELKFFKDLPVVVGVAMNTRSTGAQLENLLDVKTIKKEVSEIRDVGLFGILRKMYFRRILSQRQFRCVAGQYSCLVTPYGDVYNCSHYVGGVVSNLRETNYRLKLGIGLDAVKQCKGCPSACETYHTMIFRPWEMLSWL